MDLVVPENRVCYNRNGTMRLACHEVNAICMLAGFIGAGRNWTSLGKYTISL